MPKPRAFLKQSKTKKKAAQVLETADDFQAAGVDYEEAAGKWRAGDAVKSMRFFSRALEVYDQGLQRFPNSLDLAYNKARVLLEIATHPILVKQLPVPYLDALQQALQAHQYALHLDQDNADTLFNTAQVLTAIAEAYAKDLDRPDQDALQPLEEALELQSRCLAVQELQLDESDRQQNEATAQMASENPTSGDTESTAEDSNTSTSNKEDQWFAIVEPVTKDTLVETVLAQLGTLTTLCSILSSASVTAPPASLGWIEELSTKLIKAKLPFLLGPDADPERLQEVAMARANLVSALVEAGYRAGSIDSTTYKRERDEAFQTPDLELERSFGALLANANSLVAFNSALAEHGRPDDASQRWSALSAVMANMTAASKLSDPIPADIAETHFVRGNCSLLQYRLGRPPIQHPAAVANAAQLLKNADTFYRNAGKLYPDDEQKRIAQLRGVVTHALQTGNEVRTAVAGNNQGMDEAWTRTQLDEMVDEGLIS